MTSAADPRSSTPANAAPPEAGSLTTSPLRNRIRVDLHAPVSRVWELLGDPARYPEYSSGLTRVDPVRDAGGRLTAYVCHFKPQEEGGEELSHREDIRWYGPQRGYASSAEEANAFGLRDDLTLVTLDPSPEGTILKWDVHFDADDLDLHRAAFAYALADIGDQLIRRFGGRFIEQYVDAPPAPAPASSGEALPG